MKSTPFSLASSVAIVSLFVSGCAANYPLAESNPQQAVVKVAGTAESNYRSILGFARESCYKMATEAQYYPDAKEGEITLTTLLNGGKIKVVWMRFDIKQIETESEVTITYRKKSTDFRDSGLLWAKGNAAPCPV